MVSGSIDSVIQQHADDAAFLWFLRDAAVSAPHYKLADLAALDDRCAAHLDGLRIAGQTGEALAFEAFSEDAPGETFAASVLCVLSQNSNGLRKALGESESGNFKGFASALGWLPWNEVAPVAQSCIEHSSDFRRAVGIAAYAIQRQDPEHRLVDRLQDDNTLVLARSLRATGELGRKDCLPQVNAQLESEDESCRFWSAWSGVRLGDSSVNKYLKTYVNFDTVFAYRALQLAPRAMELAPSRNWLKGLASKEDTRRLALIGCGVVGDPNYVSTLVSQMSIPEFARVAGEAFSMITGVDLAYEDLDGDWPEGFEAGPTEDPEDENVDLDEDEDLPWPDPVHVQQWWDANGGHFQKGQRYLCGRPITDENCRWVLKEGFQRQRIAAAYELALMKPDEPLFEWRAPGFRQQEWLGIKRR